MRSSFPWTFNFPGGGVGVWPTSGPVRASAGSGTQGLLFEEATTGCPQPERLSLFICHRPPRGNCAGFPAVQFFQESPRPPARTSARQHGPGLGEVRPPAADPSIPLGKLLPCGVLVPGTGMKESFVGGVGGRGRFRRIHRNHGLCRIGGTRRRIGRTGTEVDTEPRVGDREHIAGKQRGAGHPLAINPSSVGAQKVTYKQKSIGFDDHAVDFGDALVLDGDVTALFLPTQDHHISVNRDRFPAILRNQLSNHG